MKAGLLLRGAAVLGGLVVPLAAHAVLIDFNDLADGTPASPIVYSNAGGSGIDVTFSAGNFLVQDQGGVNKTAILSVAPNRSPITITFSSLIDNFSLDTGDYGQDDDSPVTIQLYDASNNLIDTVSSPWTGDITSDAYLHLASSATGVKTVIFSSGGVFPNSMYVDNVSFEGSAVPEPSTMAALGVGCAVLLRKRRKSS